MCESLFIIKTTGIQPAILFKKKDSAESFSLWTLQKFRVHLLYRTPPLDFFFFCDAIVALAAINSSQMVAGIIVEFPL